MLPDTIRAVLMAIKKSRTRFLFFGLEALNAYAKAPSESFTTKDSDFLMYSGPGTAMKVVRKLRNIRWPEPVRVIFVGALGGGVIPIYDGKRWINLHDVSDNGTLSISTPAAFYSLDLAFGEPPIPFDVLERRSNSATLFGVRIKIANKADLLELKRLAGREKDKLILRRLGHTEKVRPPNRRSPK